MCRIRRKIFIVNLIEEPYPVKHEIAIQAKTKKEAIEKATKILLENIEWRCDALIVKDVHELEKIAFR